MNGLDKIFSLIVYDMQLPLPVAEYKFMEGRKFRFDFAWPDIMVAVELEGGVWTGGRHVRAIGYERDCEKYNLAAISGWKVLRFTSTMLMNGMAESMLKLIFKEDKNERD